MDTSETFRWTPQHCNRQRYELATLILSSPHKELGRLYEGKISDYAFQGTLYGLVMACSFIALSWTRYRVIKVHKPGAIAVLVCGGGLGWMVGTAIGAEKALIGLGRIAEDPKLDQMRSDILEHCGAKVK